MTKPRPTRDGFGEGLLELGRGNPDVVVLCADLTESTRASWFQKEFPDRFFGMGVAEQDMFGTAAGLALGGKIPYACSFGVFSSGRAWDQIRVSVAYMNLNVKIVGSHGGISVGPDGATHQAIEEITLMRALANMTVLVPCDFLEAKKATVKSAAHNGPVYLRFGRGPAPIVTKEEDDFEIGKAITLREGKDLTIIACGIMVHEALQAHDILKKEGISARVLNMHTPKPIDEEALLKAAKETGAIVTAEEHTTAGGMGSAVCEYLSAEMPVPVKMVGICDCFGESGEPDELLDKFGLRAKDIVWHSRGVLEMKK
jgi:transketolase